MPASHDQPHHFCTELLKPSRMFWKFWGFICILGQRGKFAKKRSKKSEKGGMKLPYHYHFTYRVNLSVTSASFFTGQKVK
jgi:hypothetical protein